MIEIEIQNILNTVEGIVDKVFMINAPELTLSPYAIYTVNRTTEEYTLDGVTDNQSINCDINVYSKDTLELKEITKRIRSKLLSLLGTTQGAFIIQKVKLDMRDFYDYGVDLYRTVIELEIYI